MCSIKFTSERMGMYSIFSSVSECEFKSLVECQLIEDIEEWDFVEVAETYHRTNNPKKSYVYYKTDNNIKVAKLKLLEQEDFKINTSKCPRCNKEQNNLLKGSFFNKTVICKDCYQKEEKHPNYKLAKRLETEACLQGWMNFPGIGYTEMN